MGSKEVGIEQARKTLGDLADAAYHRGEVNYLTRHGRRIAAIVPIDLAPKEHVMTGQEIAYAVSFTMADHTGDFDVDAIVEEIQTTYGPISSIDDIPSEEYWKIVERHDTSESGTATA